jgi:glutamyl-tRNA synthetase
MESTKGGICVKNWVAKRGFPGSEERVDPMEDIESAPPVRVRFAPSPTGFFHIGGARTALFNWLYARHWGGTFVLRIEDTDRQRDNPEMLRVLLDGLRWLGLDWDEGPDVGGPFGPYFQSERGKIYESHLKKLEETGRTYERDGATYFRVSGKPVLIPDAIRGPVHRLEEKDFVIVRSDGSPVFHLVNVVDDMAMRITHVIRGEDHLSNASKHVELFQAFGAPLPVFAHIPLILKTEGSGKMSKRDTGALVEDYRRRHFLPAALRNYLCLLGWSPKNDREILPLEEIVRLFDLGAVNGNNARFDEKKMAHMNGEYIRLLSPADFLERALPLLRSAGFPIDDFSPAYGADVLRICREKVRNLEDLPAFCAHFFTEDFSYDPRAQRKIFQNGDPRRRVEEFMDQLRGWNGDFSEKNLETAVHRLAEATGHRPGDYIHALRFAVSGQAVGPSFYALLCTLGKDRVRDRLHRFLQKKFPDNVANG